MKPLHKLILPLVVLAGVSILFAQDTAKPQTETVPAQPAVRTAASIVRQYEYRIEMLTPPELNPAGTPAGSMPQLSSLASGFEIHDIKVVKLNTRQNANDPNPPKTREVLIYTLRKPVP